MISTNVIKSICNSAWIHKEGVRFIVVDVDKSSAETVRTMQKESGNEEAIFCYDETGAASSAMFDYLRNTSGTGFSVTLPVLVIIDGNNKVQYCRTGNTTANVIYSYVADVAGWDASEQVEIYVEGTFDEEQAFQTLDLVNQARVAQGKNPLKMDEVLLEKAMQRAAECSIYYNHTRPNGKSCFSILESPYSMECGENIAAGYRNADDVVEGWLNSPGHYANIMNDDFESIGIGCFYQNGARYWTQLFSGYSGIEKDKGSNSVKKVVVKADSNNIGSLTLQYEKQELCVGETAKPILRLDNLGFGFSVPSTDNITFQTSNETVAKVDEDGTLHACSQGSAIITASLNDVVKAEYVVAIEPSKPDETLEPKPGETSEPKPDETSKPSPGDTSKPSETIEPKPNKTSEPKPNETLAPMPGDTQKPGETTAPNETPTKNPGDGPTQKPSAITPGDADLDGGVDLTDAQIVLKAALGIDDLSGDEWKAADVNQDGAVNLSDAQLVLKLALGIPVDLPDVNSGQNKPGDSATNPPDQNKPGDSVTNPPDQNKPGDNVSNQWQKDAENNISYQSQKVRDGVVCIVKNNNPYAVDISAKAVFYKGQSMLDTSYDENYCLEKNAECVLRLYAPYDSDKSEYMDYDSYKINFSVEEGQNLISDAKGIIVKSNLGKGNVTAELTNSTDYDFEFIHTTIIFYDKEGNIIGYEAWYADCEKAGSVDYLSYSFPYDYDTYDTIVPADYKIYVDFAYAYTWE